MVSFDHVAFVRGLLGRVGGAWSLAAAAMLTLGMPGAVFGEPITYQGVLKSLGEPVFGPVDIRATLFDADTDGVQVGATVEANVGTEPDGSFSVELDFGDEAFGAGQVRWLQLEVASPAGSGDYTLLNPRQRVAATPMAQGLAGIEIVRGGGETVDQAQDSLGTVSYSSNNSWQSFTAGVTGALTGVRLQVREVSIGNQGNITVQLRDGVGTGGALLATSSLTFDPAPVPDFRRTITIGFPSVAVARGQRYTLVFSGDALVRSSSNTIPGAEGFWLITSVSFWFQTLVAPSPRMSIASLTADVAATAANAITAQTASHATTSETSNVALAAPWLGLTGQAAVQTGAIGAGWQMLFNNTAQAGFRGGIRLADSGFLELTNSAAAPSPSFARLNSAGVWTIVSDARLKHDVSPLSPAEQLDRVLKLRPVAFTWNSTGQRDVGLIAQEVREVVPELVVGDERTELLTVNYSQLSVAAVAAIQEMEHRHRRETAELEARIKDLTARLEALETRTQNASVKSE